MFLDVRSPGHEILEPLLYFALGEEPPLPAPAEPPPEVIEV